MIVNWIEIIPSFCMDIVSERERNTFKNVQYEYLFASICLIQIYSDIRSYQFVSLEYIRKFVCVRFCCTNIT